MAVFPFDVGCYSPAGRGARRDSQRRKWEACPERNAARKRWKSAQEFSAKSLGPAIQNGNGKN